ncbi:pentatricopeptide repeat-containing protein, chloroplastic [Iris pallida]|uniref:Pentatricopeptide repeat-containing protein, chloroplastic n=1 Tax=Iris pallida TaxID=29817 RepID=A0AAX6HFM4_IRIPA|nr:pentatricopeptide repeat-containing protein, chloroplastic [Iris pallida]
MATCSSDWSLAPVLHPKLKALYSISISHHNVLSVTHSSSSSFNHQKIAILNSSKTPSPLLEDSSSGIKLIQLSSESKTDQQPPISESDISDEDIRGLCNGSKSRILTFEDYRTSRERPDYRPDSRTVDFLVNSLTKTKRWKLISIISEDFRAFDVYPSKSTCRRLITDCVRARKFKMVESLLESLQEKKEIAVSAFGAAMRGYNKLHMYSSTVSALNAMRTAGLLPDGSCYLSAMDAYRKLGGTENVLALFTEFETGNGDGSTFHAQMYWVLCDALGRSSRAFDALRYFREMVEKGLSPNPSFYASLICSFAGIREAEIAEDLFQEAREKGMVKDPAVFLKLVLMYVDLGSVEKTIAVVEAMKESRIKVSDCIQCAVVNGYATKRGLRASVRAYEQLKSLGCMPGQVTYASIINVYCRLGLSLKVEAVFSEMMEKGFDRCVVAYSNMISMYGKAGRERDAMRLLAKMKEKGCEPNVWVYNSLLDMHGRLMNLRKVEKLWKEMKRRGITPDKISYSSIITAYSKAREYDECLTFYEEFRMTGEKVDRVLAGIMVGVFSKSSRVDELVKLLQDLKLHGTGLDARLYKSSLNALRDAGLQVHAKWLAENFKCEMDGT